MPDTPAPRRRRVRWWHTALALVLLAVILAAVFFLPGEEPAQQRRQGPPGTGPLTIVSIGDSTLSGEGTGTYTPDTDGRGGNWCHRSPDATIHHTDLPGVRRKINLACSGANTEHVRLTKARKYTEGSQAAQLREIAKTHRVAAVVVAIGANDDPRFSARLTECAKAYWGTTPCTEAMARDWPQIIDRMRPKVVQALDDIRTVLAEVGYRRGDYQLVLQSYPSPVSPDIPESLRSLDGCPFRVSDLKWIHTTGVRELSEGLRQAAEEAGARFLDLSRAGEGHEACTGGDDPSSEWFTRLTVRWDDLRDEVRASHATQESYHANKEGHRQIGRCLTEFLAMPEPRAACLAGPDGTLHAAPSE
jgi:hypothetical protein